MENRSAKDTMNAKYPKYAKVKPIRVGKHNWIDRELTSAPVWCSVDLRDGNQALPMPMNPEKKLEYFKLLCAVGFKEIEVSFPSASQDDFDFVRKLVDGNEIPGDVRISVLTQARENLIRRTVESLKGLDRGILHLYVATSDLHSRIVFGKNRDEVKQMAVDGTKLVIRYLKEADANASDVVAGTKWTQGELDAVVPEAVGKTVEDLKVQPVPGVHFTEQEIQNAQYGDPAYQKTVDDWKIAPVDAVYFTQDEIDTAEAAQGKTVDDWKIKPTNPILVHSLGNKLYNSSAEDESEAFAANKLIGQTLASESDYLEVTITIWVEGWQKFNNNAIWDAVDYIDSQFNVGIQFAVQDKLS